MRLKPIPEVFSEDMGLRNEGLYYPRELELNLDFDKAIEQENKYFKVTKSAMDCRYNLMDIFSKH